MQIGFVIYGSLDTLSGGYLYDRKLVDYLRSEGDTVEVISLPWRNYAAHLTDNFRFRFPSPNVIARRVETRSVEIPTKQSPHYRNSTFSQETASHTVLRSVQGKSLAVTSFTDKFDILIQDELNHPSLIFANWEDHQYPIISLVHHLRCSELRPKWQNALYRVVERKYLQSVDGFIFNSQTTQGVVNSLIGKPKPGVVAYPPTDRFGEPISEKEVIERAKSEELRVLFLGNVIERKGLHTLLKAVSIQPSSFRVDVVGSLNSETAYAKKMQEFVSNNGMTSRVMFHSSLDNESLIEKLNQAHVLVVPSSYEGFGIVYLEGMCFGLPAIGATAGAAGEIISDGVDGFLIGPEDVHLLAGSLKILNKKRDVLIQMSLAARSRYLRQPKWEQTASQIRAFLLKQIREFSV